MLGRLAEHVQLLHKGAAMLDEERLPRLPCMAGKRQGLAPHCVALEQSRQTLWSCLLHLWLFAGHQPLPCTACSISSG